MSKHVHRRGASPAQRENPRGGAPAQERELRAQGRKTMRKLLDAGMEVLDKRGYHATRVDDIVKLAKTSHGTFYLYFSNKEDLLSALIHDVADEMNALARELPPIEAGPDGYDVLRAWLQRFVDLYRHYGSVIRAWIEAETQREFASMGAQILGEFSATLAKRIDDANLNGAVNPGIAAIAFVSMLERFLFIQSALSRTLDFDEAEVLDTLATIVHSGIFGGQRQAGGSRRRR